MHVLDDVISVLANNQFIYMGFTEGEVKLLSSYLTDIVHFGWHGDALSVEEGASSGVPGDHSLVACYS